MLASGEGRELLEDLYKFRDSKKDKIFETLKENADKAVLERHVYMGIEETINYIELLKEVSEKEVNKKIV